MKPDLFVVFGEAVPIEYTDSEFMEDCGHYDREKKSIVIKEGEGIDTLLHEFLHAVEDRLSFRQAIDESTFELINDQLCKALLENFDITPKK